MAKKMKQIVAGQYVWKIVYTAPFPHDGVKARSEKKRASTAARKAMNDKAARRKLEMVLASNFSRKDLFVTLTYDDAHLPCSLKEAKKKLRRFLDMLRDNRKKHHRACPYVYVTEHKHGEGRYHHHLVIGSNGSRADIEEIASLWTNGTIIDSKHIDERDFAALALYMTKESAEDRPVGAQMWTGSKGLKRPVESVVFVSDDTGISPPPRVVVLEREEKTVGEYGWYSYIKYFVPIERETEMRGAHFSDL